MTPFLGTLALVAFICIPLWLLVRNEKPRTIRLDYTHITRAIATAERPTQGRPTVTVTYDSKQLAYVVATRHPAGYIVVQIADEHDMELALWHEAEALLREAS